MFKAKSHYSVLDDLDLIEFLKITYNLSEIESIHLHRSFIGDVYMVKTSFKSYIMKIYKTEAIHNNNIENNVLVMNYLWHNNQPVPEVIKTKDGSLLSQILASEGERFVVLTSHISGTSNFKKTPEINTLIGEKLADMRILMKDYPMKQLNHVNEDVLIERFIGVLETHFSHRVDEISFFKHYGDILSKKIKELKRRSPETIGFCHGDFHNGNIIIEGEDVRFIDFDACGLGSKLNDIATYCNEMDYFNYDYSESKQTEKNIKEFTKHMPLTRYELDAIPLFIALRHYELNGTVPISRVSIEGHHWLNDRWLESQYNWLHQWYLEHHEDQ